MKKYLIGLLLLVAGVICGATGSYIAIHTDLNSSRDATKLFSRILPYFDYDIRAENYSCEGGGSRKVGDILSAMVGTSLTRTVNALSAGCAEGVCSIVLGHCLPWQTSECGSRMLVVSENNSGEILPTTFKCLDIP